MAREPASPLLTTDDLRRWSGYQRQADVRRWLDEHGVPYLVGRHGPVTTVSAIESTLGIRPPEPLDEDSDWSVVSRTD